MNVALRLTKAMRKELLIIFSVLGVLIVLPLFTVVVFASSGISIVSNALAATNLETQRVELFDPNGVKQSELELSTLWPTRGIVTDEFGNFSRFRKLLNLSSHRGIDIANSTGISGEPVSTFLEGEIVYVDSVGLGTCGKNIRIKHDSNIESLYCHLDTTYVASGTKVYPGNTIGLMGNSGLSTGPHLHFQIEAYGIPVDPRVFLIGEPEWSSPVGQLRNSY